MRRCCCARPILSLAGGALSLLPIGPRLLPLRSYTDDTQFHSRPPQQDQRPQSFQRRGGGRGGGGGGQPHRQHHHQPNRHRGGPIKDRYPPITVDLADPRRRLAILVDGTNSNLLSNCATRQDILTHSSLYTNVMSAVLKFGVPVLLRIFAHQLPAEWEPLLTAPSSAGRPAAAESHSGGGGSLTAMNDAAASVAGSDPVVVPLPADGTGTPADEQQKGSNSNRGEAFVAGAAPPAVVVEYFRVERFIPIPMQMEADAQHLYDFRFQNKVEGVCYVCHEVDRALYEALMDQQLGRAVSGAGGSTPDSIAASVLLPQSGAAARHGEQSQPNPFFNQYLFDELGLVKEVAVDGRSPDGS